MYPLIGSLAGLSCLLLVGSLPGTASLTMTNELNPLCNLTDCINNTAVDLVYTHSVGATSSLHYLWSSFGGAPGFLLVETQPTAALNVNWTDLLDDNSTHRNAISFGNGPDSVLNSVGVLFSEAFFWSDVDDSGNFNTSSDLTTFLDWKQFKVEDVGKTLKSTNDSSSARFTLTNDKNLTIVFEAFTRTVGGRSDLLPHLLFTPETFHVEMVMKGTTNQTYKNVRLGAKLVAFHKALDFDLNRKSFIDDEYTPGVFSKYTVSFDDKKGHPSFVEWKPIGYSKAERIIAHTLDAIYLQDETNITNSPQDNTPMYAFYSGFEENQYQVSSFYVTFGSKKESFYDVSNYTSFSFISGVGEEPQEKLSLLVEMIIMVGFGLPLVVMLLSALYIVVKKLKSRRRSNQPLLSTESGDYGLYR